MTADWAGLLPSRQGLDTNYEFTSRDSVVFSLPALAEAAQKKWVWKDEADEEDARTTRTTRTLLGPSREELLKFSTVARVEEERAAAARLKRWAMLSAARELLPTERVAQCLRRPAVRPGQKLPESVEIHRAADLKEARFHRLAVCGDVWKCPICGPRIARERAEELREAGRTHLKAGGGALLATLTFRHHKGDDLDDLLTRFAAAREDLHRQRAFRDLLKSVGHEGDIRTLEVTHGENGWHPHTHDLLFIKAPLPFEGDHIERVHEIGGESLTIRARRPAPLVQFGQDYFRLWRTSARKFGLEVVRDAFRLRATLATATEDEWDDLTGYLQDRHEVDFEGGWDAAKEMTGAASKLGRRGGRTPMQLLADYAVDGDVEAGRLFAVYAKAFHGHQQLTWSRGLKAKLLSDAPKKTDQEAAEYIPAEYTVWARLSWGTFKTILRVGGRVRGELLHHAGRDDRAAFLALVRSCEDGSRVEPKSLRARVRSSN